MTTVTGVEITRQERRLGTNWARTDITPTLLGTLWGMPISERLPRHLLTVTETAERLNVSVSTVRRRIWEKVEREKPADGVVIQGDDL